MLGIIKRQRTTGDVLKEKYIGIREQQVSEINVGLLREFVLMCSHDLYNFKIQISTTTDGKAKGIASGSHTELINKRQCVEEHPPSLFLEPIREGTRISIKKEVWYQRRSMLFGGQHRHLTTRNSK
eukprot:TRINITY_DN2856_c0_g1_i2.p2 TRINITY_DN2856_c0_g1~~TRINITY_DN2856_c0_g1_i2.p2  ORF type:complete len:126 (+),score=13.33 TRINITY_DN2856_c0_g1_i2:448-825(+)